MSNVYILKNGKRGAYKIGTARNVEKRRDHLQIGNPNELIIVAIFKFKSSVEAYRIEHKLHKMFKKTT